MNAITLRPATPADSEFCFQLHKAAMGAYVTAIWGWDEQTQRDYHTRGFDPDHWQIITALMNQADRQGQDLLLDVLAVNHRAQALYRRLGLREVARHGNNKIRMRYTRSPGQPPRHPIHSS